MLPRGIRNNNPLNIRRSKDQWKGLRAQQTDASLTSGRLSSRSADSKQASVCSHYDAEFCQFESLEYGWRAAFYLLTRTYYHQYRLFTIRAIINRWAPPRENLTSTYIANVSRLTGIPPDEPIGIPSDQPERWMAVGIAMAIQENGLIKREQSELAHSAEREDGRAKLNGTDSLDYFAMLRGWGLARDPSVLRQAQEP